ncbi:MAG: hypothetical protein HUJ65_06600, partial [Oscillospiraceae bacterium]|nr:hypothetical protein [Oscillospiraceae bacterium]
MKETFVKMFILRVGGFRMAKNNIGPGVTNGDVPIVMPIYTYLIKHPTEGYLLVDTGQNYNIADEVAVGTHEDSVVNQLKKV